MLKRLRLIDELDLMHISGERHYYEARTRRDHMHLACFDCGAIREFAEMLLGARGQWATLVDQYVAERSATVHHTEAAGMNPRKGGTA